MKKLYTLAILFTVAIGFSQNVTNNNENNQEIQAVPPGYYNAATGTGYALKTQLRNIITNGHIDKGYGSGTNTINNGLWTAFATTDRDMGIGFENDNTIVDMYSENPDGADPYNYTYNSSQCGNGPTEGICYNREHIVPQSYFDEVTTSFTRSDAHHIYPTDARVNNERGNYAFGKISNANYTSQNGSKRGPLLNSGYSSGAGTPIVFEPIDEFKGDIARAILYFATRYETQMSNFYNSVNVTQCASKIMFDGTNDHVFNPTFLNILLAWNEQDPVSDKEIIRNNAVYAHQGNRNPYIDNNSYVTSIWGSALSTQTFDFASVSVYPNPSNNHRINIDTEIILDEIQLINLNGQLIQEIKNPNSNGNTYTVENLPSGFYFLKISSDNQTTTKKVIVN